MDKNKKCSLTQEITSQFVHISTTNLKDQHTKYFPIDRISDQFVEEGVLDGIHTKFALFTSFIVSIPHLLFVLFQPINKNLPLWNNKMTKLLLMLMIVNVLRCAGEMSDEF